MLFHRRTKSNPPLQREALSARSEEPTQLTFLSSIRRKPSGVDHDEDNEDDEVSQRRQYVGVDEAAGDEDNESGLGGGEEGEDAPEYGNESASTEEETSDDIIRPKVLDCTMTAYKCTRLLLTPSFVSHD